MNPQNLTEFLNTMVDHRQNEFDQPQKIECWKRLAYLMYCNGGSLNVGGYGITGYGGGIFKSGLTQNEALELISLEGMIIASSWYDTCYHTLFLPKMDNWLKELHEQYEKEMEEEIKK